MAALRSLTATFAGEGGATITVRYRRDEDGANHGTKARAREARDLAREGLEKALAALSGEVEVVGSAGFSERQDVLACGAVEAGGGGPHA